MSLTPEQADAMILRDVMQGRYGTSVPSLRGQVAALARTLARVDAVTVEEVARVIFDETQRAQNDVTAWESPIIDAATREAYRAEAAAVLALIRARVARP